MKKPLQTREQPKALAPDRSEQLRRAKRAQRKRQRQAGLATVELQLPAPLAKRLRIAARTADFGDALEALINELVLDIDEWPVLRTLAWNRADKWIPAEEAFALYERNWRFVTLEQPGDEEARLIDRLKEKYGDGMLNV